MKTLQDYDDKLIIESPVIRFERLVKRCKTNKQIRKLELQILKPIKLRRGKKCKNIT